LLKLDSHNISILGELTLSKDLKDGRININFNENPIYNMDAINVNIFGKESLKWLLNIPMQKGLLNVKGDFINLHNWKIDYAIRDVTFEEIGEKKFDKPIALNGYGIIEDTNGLYTSGRLHINGIMPNQIDVRHYYDNATLNITLRILKIY